jgi:hypothetical protein
MKLIEEGCVMKKKPGGAKKQPLILMVQVLEAKPNKMFTEEQRQLVRFLRYNQTIPCVECGKRRRIMWTMFCTFRAMNFDSHRFNLEKSTTKIHAPLAPVCGAHPLAPAWPDNGN